MPKKLLKTFVIIFFLAPSSLKAQIAPPLPKYTPVEDARNYLYYVSYSKAHKISYKDSVILRIDSANQLRQAISQKAIKRIVGVDILTENRPNLEEIFKLLTQFPYLRQLRITDRYVPFADDKPYQLPATINQLRHLTSLSFSGTNKLDMDDDASFKLMDHRPTDAIALLNKKVISGWDLSAKTLLTVAANYIIDPKTYDEGEKSLREIVKKRGKIKYYGFVPITAWLAYSNYTADQKQHLTALQQIAYN